MMQPFFFLGYIISHLTQALTHFYEISLTFKRYRDVLVFQMMCEKMEAKFLQYWKFAPLTLCLVVALDPALKLVGLETLLDAMHNKINQTNVNDTFTIKTYLVQLYLEYTT